MDHYEKLKACKAEMAAAFAALAEAPISDETEAMVPGMRADQVDAVARGAKLDRMFDAALAKEFPSQDKAE